jgi:hypothetical protein
VSLLDKHVSIDVPSGWISERNYSIAGVTYDLYMESPASGGYKADGTLLTGPWLGSITDNTLYAAMKQSIDEVKTAFGSANVEIVSAPANTTIGGEHANDVTLKVTVSGTVVKERFVIVVSSVWKEQYALAFAVVDSQWDSYSGAFSASMNSLTFAQKQGGTGELPVALIAGAVLVVIVIAAVVALLMIRKKKQPTSILQQPAQPPMPPIQQSGPPQNP